MTNEFLPIPAEGKKYHSEVDGSEYLVTHVELDPQSSYVEATSLSTNNMVEFEPDDWNNLNFTMIDSEPIPSVEEEHDTHEDEEATNQEMQAETPSLNVEPDNTQVDPKLNRLHLFLHNKPLEKMPFDFPETVFQFKTEREDQIKENDVLETDVENYINENFYKREIEERREQGRKKENHSNLFNEFLWTCAGVDKPLIRMCPQDKAKKAGIGGTILFTALMAALSGTLVVSTMFPNTSLFWCLAFGLFWGALIFNLDRYMTNSMYTDGTSRITRKEWLSALPRIIIAIILGTVISTPIELRLFEGEINKQIQNEQLNDNNTRNASFQFRDRLDALYQQRAYLQNVINKNTHDADSLNIRASDEGQGLHGQIGQGPRYKSIKDAEIVLRNSIIELKEGLKDVQEEIKSLEEKRDQDNIVVNEKEVGIGPQLKTLYKITSADTLLYVRVFIWLFFVILEIVPVLSKMMAENGEYEKFLEAESDAVAWKLQIKKFNLQNLIRSGKLHRYERQILSVNDDRHGRKERKKRDSGLDNDETMNEGDLIFQKHDYLFENKRRVEEANHNVIERAVSLVEDYTIELMTGIFHDIYPANSPRSQHHDVSDDAVEIQ